MGRLSPGNEAPHPARRICLTINLTTKTETLSPGGPHGASWPRRSPRGGGWPPPPCSAPSALSAP
eukprot:CAMPEP_0180298706 /NCGR_PEP_ID=MMETSP0988-20121125/21532_1 /TAXON_ID=697907 /ORGANISM="non described non described, Strain CCMP2293" /LENGTH=64 /DNA_ID=CAMNT_0022278083 /DNA_START=98 /DNA_END=288 /DNA_ORIENTATION=-